MSFEKQEFKFPDEGDNEVESQEIEIEVVDDTPEADRGREDSTTDKPLEEVTDEDLQHYNESVRKRIKKFSKGYHDERRAREAALREKEEALALAQRVIEENKRLQGSVNQGQNALLEQAKKAVAAEVEEAKRKYKAAYESGDPDALVSAQEALTEAKFRAERVKTYRPQAVQQPQNVVQPDVQATNASQDTKALAWQDRNRWFGKDRKMTAFALAVHEELTVDKGVDPRSDEYYKQLDANLRKTFPEQFDSGEADAEPTQRRKSNVVGSATRSTAPKKIVLTATQVSLAKRLGIPLEAYAKQVAAEMRK